VKTCDRAPSIFGYANEFALVIAGPVLYRKHRQREGQPASSKGPRDLTAESCGLFSHHEEPK
jgi:hypothetical protein